jgi:hypothetical protein
MLGIPSIKQKTLRPILLLPDFLFLHVPDVKLTQTFCNVIFWEIEDHEKKNSTENETWQKIGGPHGTTCWPHGGAHLPLVGPFNAILDSTDLT